MPEAPDEELGGGSLDDTGMPRAPDDTGMGLGSGSFREATLMSLGVGDGLGDIGGIGTGTLRRLLSTEEFDLEEETEVRE